MDNTLKKEDKSTKSNSLAFVKEVAKYFMDFLETDFHKHKLPRRSIKLRNEDNLLVGINLQKYPSFSKAVLQSICNGFQKDDLKQINKGVYKTSLPKNLLDLIVSQIEKISDDEVSNITQKISEVIEKHGILTRDEYDVALNSSIDEINQIIRVDLISPFIKRIEKPLQNLSLGDEDDIYLIEEELSTIVLHLLENKVSEILNRVILNEKFDLINEISIVFSCQDIKRNLVSFFENLQVADLFLELFELERNKNILEKQDFYLYFGDITFNNNKYPIFYIPFELKRDQDVLLVEFDERVYINKKALEFIVQEYNNQKETNGSLQGIQERIIYLSGQNDFAQYINKILNEITHFFKLSGNASFDSSQLSNAKSSTVRISNNCHICLFDKSDESLVNDYEEILQKLNQDGGILADGFNKLIDDFIHNNPISFNSDIENGWDDTEISDRLVYSSPIPLNSEQQQILSAVKKEGCDYIIVSGPPGTGKSHTITAIIFDAILKNQSVLVLSDKKEALDVVEDKITKTMNKVRYDEHFQNPILRLGKTGNTYNSILSHSTIEGIKTYYHAVKKEREAIEDTVAKSINSLKDDLNAEIVAYKNIDISEIYEYFNLERYFHDRKIIFDIDEVASQEEAIVELGDLKNLICQVNEKLLSKDTEQILDLLGLTLDNIKTFSDYKKFVQSLDYFVFCIEQIDKVFANNSDYLKHFSSLKSKDLFELQNFIESFSKLNIWPFGYLFTRRKVEQLDAAFRERFIYPSSINPHEHISDLEKVCEIIKFSSQFEENIKKKQRNDVDYFLLIHRLIIDHTLPAKLDHFSNLTKEIILLENVIDKYSKTSKIMGIDKKEIKSILKNKIVDLPEFEFDKQIRYLNLKQKIDKDFAGIRDLNYATRMSHIEGLFTIQVTHLLDKRLINFYDNIRNDADALRTIIKNKQRFPKEVFGKLKEAFPCILAGIRDYAEYIPLEPAVFDLVIIDEASQVSIAQAFPALLRAKKVLILGDKKQFSNVKAGQARSDTNREYLNNLSSCFKKNISTDSIKLVRLEKFNIKTSILDFFNSIGNYTIQLLKYFRGYKEIISYSNKYFYQNSLQAMKIRGKPIDDVIKFSFVEAKEEDELYPNTNLAEVEFIISELKSLKENDKSCSVGIITPHTNQQKLLMEKINQIPERDYFFDKLQLKIMTFDTCQGEERDIIYYSMVASEHTDKLWGVFIKNLNNVDIEEDGQIKAQRLNVGFSRAKECMHFVLSKGMEGYSGSIGDALRHYQYILEESRKEHNIEDVDKRSKMEPVVLNWFYQTKFWANHKDSSEFIPQFEIGKYLKQLDRTYTHPDYKVDFLLIYNDEDHREHKIIIEYDGFHEHFRNLDEVNEFNYKDYYSDDDIYRQKVLEGYGYKFLRINKFNCGKNPIETLDERIGCLLRNTDSCNPIVTNIRGTIKSLQNGEMQECPRCKEVKPRIDFQDNSLITGYGRFCKSCKGKGGYSKHITERVVIVSDKICPICNAKMVLRNSKRGKFYGCSRFPYCRCTINYNE